MKRLYIFFAVAMVLIPVMVKAQKISSGKAVIQQMNAHYKDSWYRYMTFKQITSFYKKGVLDHAQTWYEALSLPGKLAIKFDSLKSGTGVLFRQDSVYAFRENKLTKNTQMVHDLLVLGFDVYAQLPSVTVKKLTKQGYDVSKMYERTWKGRPVYVVGAAKKGEKSNQFWIDKEHLYFVRLLKYDGKKGTKQDTQFDKYQKAGGGWVATEVLFYEAGTLKTKEEYNNVTVPSHLAASIFDTKNFKAATW